MICVEALQAAQSALAALEARLRTLEVPRIAIYGASATGRLVRRAAEDAGVSVVRWVDGAEALQGMVVDGVSIGSPSTLLDVAEATVVLATTSAAAATAMTSALVALGLGALPRISFEPPEPSAPALAPPRLYAPWSDDAVFVELYRSCADHTLVDERRCHVLYQALQQVGSLDGALAELGVYRGGTAQLLASARVPRSRPLHLFDTFAGMPEVDPGRDRHKRGDFSDTSEAAVRHRLAGEEQVHLHVGTFPQSTAGLGGLHFALVHVDADIHRSVLDACEFFYPRLVTGGLMIFDDYGFPSCPGAKAAVDDFFASRDEHVLYLQTGQAMICRLG